MAEPRRITFETVKPDSKDKKQKKNTPTHRFSLRLLESNDKTYSEYSYNDLLKSVSKDKEKNGKKDPYGDSNDNSDVIMAMAQKFEEKYGPKPGKRKKQQYWEDYVDKGLGYDETDPFIDNDEAYDELVPSSITTRHGGFYINLGELEFRAVSSDSEPFPYDPMRKKKKKKKFKDILDKRRRKKRVIRDEDGDDLIPLKKKGKILSETAYETINSAPQEVKVKVKPTPVIEIKEAVVSPVNNIQSPPAANNLASPNGGLDAESDIAKDVQIVDVDSSDCEEIVHKNATDVPQDIPKLPSNMPNDLNMCVDKLKQAALLTERGKCKFFSNEVNNVLLSVELKSREMTTGQRSMIYSHLASHLPCTKETLLKRAKKLRMDQEDGKLRKPMDRLRKVVADIMPSQKEKYALECKVAAAEIAEHEKRNENRNENEDKDKNSARVPRRKFVWTKEIRLILCEVVNVKLKCFEVMKVRTQTIEEYLRHFFETEIKDVWPIGWMNSRVLMRESKSVYAHLSKVKKTPTLMKKMATSVISVGNALPVTPSLSSASVSVLKTDTTPRSSDASAILSTIQNSTLSKISETAALPSISKLIQQTKVSSFPVAQSTAGSICATLEKIVDPKPQIISIRAKFETPKSVESNSKLGVAETKTASVVVVAPPKSSPSKVTSKFKPEPFKSSSISLTSSKPTTSKVEKPFTSPHSVINTSSSITTPQLTKEPTTAIDVLDQIISASLGNYRNTPESDIYNNSSKLVDNALIGLINASTNCSSGQTGPQRQPQSVVITKTVPAVKSQPTMKTEVSKPILQNSTDSIYKSFEKYLNEGSSSSKVISVTPVGTTSSAVPNQSASYRSSYGFHEAFLNSLNSGEIPNAMRSPTKSDPPKEPPMKKQDFYSQNKGVSLINNLKHKNSDAHVYTHAAESLASIVNLTMEKPTKSVAYSPQDVNRTMMSPPNNFIQDGLASSLLHHAAFSPEKWHERLQTHVSSKPSIKTSQYSGTRKDVTNRIPDSVIMSRPAPKRPDLIGQYGGEPIQPQFCQPSPPNSMFPQIKPPGIPTSHTQVSPSLAKFTLPHIKSPPHSLLQPPQTMYQTSPSTSIPMSLPQHHLVETNSASINSLYGQIPNYSQHQSSNRHTP